MILVHFFDLQPTSLLEETPELQIGGTSLKAAAAIVCTLIHG